MRVFILLLFLGGCQTNMSDISIRLDSEATPEMIVEAFALKTPDGGVIEATTTPVFSGYSASLVRTNVRHSDPLLLPKEVIHIIGSDIVYPISLRMADEFNDNGFVGQFEISQSTTGDEIQRFCEGEAIDIVNATRRPHESEFALCERNGRELVALQLGYGSLVFIVHADNFWLKSLDMEQLEQLFLSRRWSTLDETFPRRPLTHYFPSPQSGTVWTMSEVVYEVGSAPQLRTIEEGVYMPLTQEVIDEVAADPSGIGLVDYNAVHRVNQLAVNVVPLEGRDPLHDADYPVQEALYLITDKTLLAEKPHVATFMAYYLDNVTRELPELGFAPLTHPELYDEHKVFVDVIRTLDSSDEILNEIQLNVSLEN